MNVANAWLAEYDQKKAPPRTSRFQLITTT
jgi:hypothetical protein